MNQHEPTQTSRLRPSSLFYEKKQNQILSLPQFFFEVVKTQAVCYDTMKQKLLKEYED